ncbi:MAG: response regulator [Rhodomicrobiaceae bacterium]
MRFASLSSTLVPKAIRVHLRRAGQAIARAKAAEPLEFEQIILRYRIGFIITCYLIYAYAFEDLHAQSGAVSAIAMTAGWLIAFAVLIHLTQKPKRHVLRRTATIVNDAAVVSLIIGYGDEAAVAFFPIYLWVILGNGFRFGIGYLYAAIAANLVCFVLMASVTPHWRDAWQFSLGLAIAIVIIPLYAAKLIRNLRQAKEEAEAASRAKTEFLSMMSHELRTPLTAILGLAQVTKVTASSAKERFGAISTELAAGRLLRMVDTILKFQRIDSGAAERDDRPFHLLDMLTGIRAIIDPLAQQKGLLFHIRFTSGLPRAICSDPDYVETIILNLVTNAVKYTVEGDVLLEIGMIEGGGRPALRIAVHDTGSGIPHEAQARIFEKFVRAEGHNVASEHGVGLGLATCKSLTDLLDGKLGFQSMPDVGSVFWAELPVDPVAEEDAAASGVDDARADVLVVEPALLGMLAGLDGVERLSEDEALARLEETAGPPECVLVIDPFAASAALNAALEASGSGEAGAVAIVLVGAEIDEQDDLARAAIAIAPHPEEAELTRLLDTVARWRWLTCQQVAEGAPQAIPLVRQLTVLVADDNALNRQVARRMFELDGHRVVLAETGDEALQILLDGTPDVAFLDVNMPGMSGIDVCLAYKTGLGSVSVIPVLGLTADISEQTRRACIEAGMNEVLGKPVTLEKLRDVLSQYVLEERGEMAVRPDEAAPAADDHRIASLRELFGEDGFRDQFLPSFERDLGSSLDNLERALASSSRQRIHEALHAIKSSASTAGARDILDEADRFRDDPSPARLPAFAARIRAAFRDYHSAAVRMPAGSDRDGAGDRRRIVKVAS